MTKTKLKEILRRLRRLLKSNDLDHIAQGAALLRALDEPAIITPVFEGVTWNPTGYGISSGFSNEEYGSLTAGPFLKRGKASRALEQHSLRMALAAVAADSAGGAVRSGITSLKITGDRKKPGRSNTVRGPLDAQPLAAFGALLHLWIADYTTLSGLEAVSTLHQLQTLRTGPLNAITDLSFLAGLPELRALATSGSALTSLSGLEHATKLTALDISSSAPTELDIVALAGLPELRRAAIGSKCPLSDLSPLARCTQLTHLDLRQHSAARTLSVGCLGGLTRLRVLSLRSAATGLEIIGKMTALEQVTVHGCLGLQRLPELSGLTALRGVSLRDCDVLDDTSGLSGLPVLEHLIITSLALRQPQLAGLAALKTLELTGPIADLSLLTALPALKKLSVTSSVPLDLSGVASLPPLDTLSLTSGGDPLVAPLANMTIGQLIIKAPESSRPIDLSPLAHSTGIQRIVLTAPHPPLVPDDMQPRLRWRG